MRGALLATKSGVYLPPGPVLIALRGDWPHKSDTPEEQGSIEVRRQSVAAFVGWCCLSAAAGWRLAGILWPLPCRTPQAVLLLLRHHLVASL